ncbi:phosphatidate cytidylyltransferase [uncultured Tateyamaria sp.]|uniref:phosphatidate cytidylyltransferase n=1 Tax=Tateyamaria sp. 1078 TaxID=3417464 RepID=UPI0026076385|nr:phosphatidate cytidylyltransferase [uncultured Tateyamaria sp.]
MNGNAERWSDLGTRLGSGAAMVAIGIAGIWFGGHVFHGLVAVICGLMVWELVRMLSPDQPSLALQLGGVSAFAVLLATYLPPLYAVPLLAAAVLVGLGRVKRYAPVYLVFSGLLLLAGWGMAHVRDDLGFGWMVWLVLVVVVTDVAGYFAGRMIGGPKFWPAVSPKKTWAGTSAGWVAAALVGLGFGIGSGALGALVLASVLLSFASQLGDIAESAIKRKVGVKDSSTLIPGHGGLLDRFDGMLGAALALLVLEVAFGFPWSVL